MCAKLRTLPPTPIAVPTPRTKLPIIAPTLASAISRPKLSVSKVPFNNSAPSIDCLLINL